jgi:flagellar motor protein MotB
MATKGCKCKHAECEECPEWIFTFADLVMLMMGFFVILWVLKPSPGKKGSSDSDKSQDYVVKIAASIRGGFGYEPNPQSKDPVDQLMIINGLAKSRPPGPGHNGAAEDAPKGSVGTEQEVTNIRPSLHATEGGKMLFDKGSDALSDQMKTELQQVAEVIRGHRNIVMVKGHTSLDDLPDGATEQEKMDLSIRRAQAAADFLTHIGVEPQILRVQGCSTFEPLSQHDYTEEAQGFNRRVEVEATNTLEDDVKKGQPTSADQGETTQPSAQ